MFHLKSRKLACEGYGFILFLLLVLLIYLSIYLCIINISINHLSFLLHFLSFFLSFFVKFTIINKMFLNSKQSSYTSVLLITGDTHVPPHSVVQLCMFAFAVICFVHICFISLLLKIIFYTHLYIKYDV